MAVGTVRGDLQSVARRVVEDAHPVYAGLLDHPDPEVRVAAREVLSGFTLRRDDAERALREAAERTDDAEERAALRTALRDLDEWNVLSRAESVEPGPVASLRKERIDRRRRPSHGYLSPPVTRPRPGPLWRTRHRLVGVLTRWMHGRPC
ncbi:HEAT repeat domain-containing protein [Micromonospora endolithica]|uniref:HEAT repeat domain-containing protein n=1 Tax=Micromonospora endolithica TaxID=230091 RepID=A0A3A9YZP2_9ACTN|nr:HEAT repeat domain-containing protein [Micromonospora endolithica]